MRHGVFKLWGSVVCSKLRESKTTDSFSSYACCFHPECSLKWPYHVPDRLWPVESCRFAECHVSSFSIGKAWKFSDLLLGERRGNGTMRGAIRDFFPCMCSLMPSQIRGSGHTASLKEKGRRQHWCRFECKHCLSCVLRSVFRRQNKWKRGEGRL